MLGSLFKMLKGDAIPPQSTLGDSPLKEIPGLRLGSTVQIDTLAFRVLDLSFKAPTGDQSIEAYGNVDLGAGAELHRFYLMDDAWIQVNTQNGHVEDMKLFVFHDTKTPGTRSAFERLLDAGAEMRKPQIQVADRTWTRVWGEEGYEAEPVTYGERVYQAKDPRSLAYEVRHFSMLFERQVPESERMEYLFLSGEDTEGEFAYVSSLGVDLSVDDIKTL